MDASGLILAGIRAARQWPELGEKTQVVCVPLGTTQYEQPEEKIKLTRFRPPWDVVLYMGYGPQTDTLVFWVK